MRDDGRKHHQNEVTRHGVGEDPTHDECDAEYDLEIQQTGECRGEVAGDTRRATGRNAVGESNQSSESCEQNEIAKPGVGVVENVHVATVVSGIVTNLGNLRAAVQIHALGTSAPGRDQPLEKQMQDELEGSSSESNDALVDALTRVLAKACRQLGNAGHPSDASRIAAEGWSLLRGPYPEHAERINGAMHYLARLEQKL